MFAIDGVMVIGSDTHISQGLLGHRLDTIKSIFVLDDLIKMLPDGPSPLHVWDFGDGSYSDEDNPDHTYANPGFYWVIKYLRDEDDNLIDIQMYLIRVFNTHPISAYYWDFDDGSYSSEANPSHEFTSPGFYWVLNRITVLGVNYERKYLVRVFQPDEISTYYWDFGDGSYSSEVNPSHEFTSPGFYWVTQTITYVSGKVLTRKMMIRVFPAESTVERDWDFDDGNSDTGSVVTNEYINPGTYYPELTVTGRWGEVDTSQDETITVS